MAGYNWVVDACERPDLRDKIEAALRQWLGRPVEIRFVRPAEAPAPAPGPHPAAIARDDGLEDDPFRQAGRRTVRGPGRPGRGRGRAGTGRVLSRGPVPIPLLPNRRDAVFNNLGNLADLMRNAGKIRESVEKATEALGQVQVEGTAGGGAVSAKVNGKMELLSVRIDPKLLADGDAELLEDLVTAAVNQGLTKAREAAAAVDQLAGRRAADPGLGRDVRAGPGGA